MRRQARILGAVSMSLTAALLFTAPENSPTFAEDKAGQNDPTQFLRDSQLSDRVQIEKPLPEYEIREAPDRGATKPEEIIIVPEDTPPTPQPSSPPAKENAPPQKKDGDR